MKKNFSRWYSIFVICPILMLQSLMLFGFPNQGGAKPATIEDAKAFMKRNAKLNCSHSQRRRGRLSLGAIHLHHTRHGGHGRAGQ